MGHKIAKSQIEASQIEEKYTGKPHGWVQWKGTNVCIEIHCKCGYHSHYDGYFAHHIQCPSCGTIYYLNPHIEMIEADYDTSGLPLQKPELETED
jgi:hypothetical protein